MSENIVGLDIGFGFTKASNGHRQWLFKSVAGRPPENMPPLTRAVAGEDFYTQDIELDGERYLVGESAERFAPQRAAALEQDDLLKITARPCGLAALARMAAGNGPISVVTGLPVSYFRDYHQKLAHLLLGWHEIACSDGHSGRISRRFHVERIRVIPQPFGSVYALLLNDLGRVVRPALTRQRLGVVDVGYRTADFCICDQTRLADEGLGSSDEGMFGAYQRIADAIEQASGRRIELFRLHEAIAAGSITVDDTVFDLSGICSREFARLAATLGTRLRKIWDMEHDLDGVVITGGGGAVLEPYLRKVLPGRIIGSKKAADARLGNVRGYWRYGVQLWQS